ncbi:ABC transporter family substrate-binding protein [Streptantibioticus ferralitis]|uniref:ABC transporter family substrate-binding protein n=1 Tax=Streptantibioticus ferralitis TaxID=236510 RepID=A0ABT5ZB44_9ACTN|nr:ABC transporter family substrate-binding protein [Streptantibioticus ferralitis]MDF2261072.1 ABC transporter family substrate-binding protein [Streptantibioticus ferralitis]
MPRTAIGTIALVAVASAAAAGCSASSGGDTAPAVDVASAARSAVRDGGTLRWAVDDIPRTLNTFQSAADPQTARIAGAVLPALFTVDGRGRPQRDPDFLESATVVSKSPQVVEYKLNPKAVWSDGRPISADDFAAQWKALSGTTPAYWSAHNDGYDRISDVQRGPDAHQIKVTFSRPLATWQSLFTPLYPQAVTSSPDAFNDGSRSALPATAGPFSLQEVDARAGTATLVRNPTWWGDPAKLDRLVFTAMPSSRRAAALASGSVDVAEVSPSEKSAVSRDRRLAVHRAPDAVYTQLALNGGSGPLADERVRHAVARAIDRKAIAQLVLRPAGLPAVPLGNHLVMASQDGYQDNSSAIGGTDVKSAQALLADAGWQPGKSASPQNAAAPGPAHAHPGHTHTNAHRGHPHPATHAPDAGASGPDAGASAPDPSASEPLAAAGAGETVEPAALRTDRSGHPLTLQFVLPEHDATLGTVGDHIAHMLARIGVRTQMTRVADNSFFQDHIASGDFDLALYSWPGSAYPATDARPVYAKPVPGADGSLLVQQNYARVGTDLIDKLLDQAGSELNPGKAGDLTKRADARIWAAAGSIPLYQRPQVVAQNTQVVNVGAFGFQTPRYQDIGFRR